MYFWKIRQALFKFCLLEMVHVKFLWYALKISAYLRHIKILLRSKPTHWSFILFDAIWWRALNCLKDYYKTKLCILCQILCRIKKRNLKTAKAIGLIFFTVRCCLSPTGAFWHAYCNTYNVNIMNLSLFPSVMVLCFTVIIDS